MRIFKAIFFVFLIAGIAYVVGIPDICKLSTLSDFFHPVYFPHNKHFMLPNSCKACHHRFPEEQAKPCYRCHKEDTKTMLGLQRAYHKRCITCHKEMKKGPLVCTDCHKIKKSKEFKDIYVLNTLPGIYGSVTFPHKGHIKKGIECGSCHHILEKKPKACKSCHTKPYKNTPGLRGAYHRKCLACHSKMKKGPLKCIVCHKKNG